MIPAVPILKSWTPLHAISFNFAHLFSNSVFGVPLKLFIILFLSFDNLFFKSISSFFPSCFAFIDDNNLSYLELNSEIELIFWILLKASISSKKDLLFYY